MGSMHKEIQRLDQADNVHQALIMQKVTHLQHKVESGLQDRLAAHQILQETLRLVETRMTS